MKKNKINLTKTGKIIIAVTAVLALGFFIAGIAIESAYGFMSYYF